jgi:Xaa-Pro dipeptidase
MKIVQSIKIRYHHHYNHNIQSKNIFQPTHYYINTTNNNNSRFPNLTPFQHLMSSKSSNTTNMTQLETSKRQRSTLSVGPPLPTTTTTATATTTATNSSSTTPTTTDPNSHPNLFYPIDMSLHLENRLRLSTAMKQYSQTYHIDINNGIVLLRGGISELRHDTDHEDIFRQESFFAWTFGVKEPDCYGTVDVKTGKSILFIPTLPESYAVFMGSIRPPQSFKDEYRVDEVYYVEDLPRILVGKTLYVLHGKNTDSGTYTEPASFPGIETFRVDNGVLFPIIVNLRSIKTEKEIQLMKHINKVSCYAHAWVMQQTRPGMMEFQQESLFQHFGYYFGQCRHTSYTSICGSGSNCSVLHYGHAGAPNSKMVSNGDLCLMDMGAEFHCYGSDITCTYPANGKFTTEQKIIYEAVLKAQWEIMKILKPGISYVDCQSLAYRIICQQLRDVANILVGDLKDMELANIGAIFMPHGLGHMLGIDTHDVGGKAFHPGEIKTAAAVANNNLLTLDGYNRLRLIRPLEEGMMITVEPGIYFNDYLLDKALKDPNRAKFINVEILNRFKSVGGVRLEDDVLITKHGILNLTRVPRTVQDVEKWMNGMMDDLNDCECPWSEKWNVDVEMKGS